MLQVTISVIGCGPQTLSATVPCPMLKSPATYPCFKLRSRITPLCWYKAGPSSSGLFKSSLVMLCQETPHKTPLDERREFLSPAFRLCTIVELKLSLRMRLAMSDACETLCTNRREV